MFGFDATPGCLELISHFLAFPLLLHPSFILASRNCVQSCSQRVGASGLLEKSVGWQRDGAESFFLLLTVTCWTNSEGLLTLS